MQSKPTIQLRIDLRRAPLHILTLLYFFWAAFAASAGENASNPLAAVNNTDLRYQYFDLGGADKQDAFIDGAYMLRPDLKLKYELHYNSTDAKGTRETGLEKLKLKLIHFPLKTQLNDTWGMKTAIGLEWIVDFGDPATGIGKGSDQLAPLVGVAFANKKTGTVLLPLIQHFESYNGPTDISQTALRLIAIQPFAEAYWAKLDVIAPYDWNKNIWPVTAELQLGYSIQPGLALYTDLLFGIGSDRPYDQGLGIGIRFNY